ncbi:minor tail protein [Gordonia phage Chikenjars]|uniref:Minor tail protein n=2 Tax=Kenoshavirus TaxID=2842796 RepID=A0A410TCI9_9CAUD|nr:minor tail protein [Gordonia phage Duffington]YP_009852136.1 minor tail protein [Gordonia phage Chikenjars]QXO14058.1 minor tail protein [Gordonia phage AlainaMarie]QYC53959.1 minor tail protein [Gordonia phage Nithya]WNN94355.1 minor tail protein [Gordonia phage EndAve]QAU06740.1 minor tail protein [Gordonia phage Duffington]QEQ94337.1 minor tail protein [Gordonia phage Chikenjars]
MDLITLKDWVYPATAPGVPPYVPQDAVGRYNIQYGTASPVQQDVYRPDELVENYTSLIWKEGFRPTGAFEMKTYDIERTLQQLPLYKLVSLRDTDEVYIVTSHYIGSNDAGEDVLTVKGITYLRYLMENRPTWAYQGGPADKKNAENVNLVFQIPDHLAFVLWGAIVFPFAEGGFPNTGKAFELPMNVIVPHTAISQTIRTDKGSWYRTEWPPPIEQRITTVDQVLALDQSYGIRAIRPKNASAKIYRPYFTSLRGEGFTENETNLTKLLFDVYEARDLTVGADRIMFQFKSGDITNSEWIASIETYKNVVSSHSDVPPKLLGNVNAFPAVVSRIVWEDDAKVDSVTGEPIVGNPDVRKYKAGKNFQMGQVDANLGMPDAIEVWPPAAEAKLRSEGLKYIKEQNALEMLSADISPLTQYKYKQHYDLGDIVMVHGKYGDPQKMVVSEYTRTSDSTGISGFPTLIKWEDPEAGITPPS